MASGSRRLIYLALVANGLIAVTKFIAAAISGSSAMFAEAIHSVADTGNQLFLLRGDTVSRYAATTTYPFGRGRAMYFWAFMVAVMLFVAGGVWSIIHGWERILHPDDHHGGGFVFSLIVLGIAGVFEVFIAFIPAIREFNKRRGSRGVWQSIRESKDPALIIVVFEDAAATLGLLIAAVGLIATQVTGNAFWDGAASVAIGVLLCVVAFVVAREMKALLEGESATRRDRAAIRTAILSVPAVANIERLLTMQLAPHEILVNVDVTFDEGVDEVAAIEEVESAVSHVVPDATRIFVEPTR